jgi:hypothetical protein
MESRKNSIGFKSVQQSESEVKSWLEYQLYDSSSYTKRISHTKEDNSITVT